MGKRVCYIHLGTGKTGTTAIQYALTKNQGYLSSKGLKYPDLSRNFRVVLSGKPTAGNGAILYRKLRENDLSGAIEMIQRSVRPEQSCVVSCEGLWQLPRESLTKFASGLLDLGFLVRGLIFFRPQAEFMLSSYLQQVKAGRIDWAMSIEDYADESFERDRFGKNWNWSKVCNKLVSVFGEEQFTVHWYPTLVAKGYDEVVRSVFAWLQVPYPEGLQGGQIVNPSPNPEALIILRMANATGFGGREFADAFLAEAYKAGLIDKRPLLDEGIRERIDAATQRVNQEMLDHYLPGISTPPSRNAKAKWGSHIAPLRKKVLSEMLRLAAQTLAEQR